MTECDKELNNSYLGSKDHWDDIYVRELENYKSNQDDVGEIWFGEQTERKMVRWITDNFLDKDVAIVDVGTGNGHLLSELSEENFTNLTGIDYSYNSTELAQTINSEKNIIFRCQNILEGTGTDSYHLCLDKGTYDAISLSDTSQVDRSRYRDSISSMLKPHGTFLIASVNWTTNELRSFFETDEHLEFCKELPTKKFTFGGVTGQDVSIVVFKHVR